MSSGNDTASLATGDAVFLGANEPGGTLTATRDAVAYVALATT